MGGHRGGRRRPRRGPLLVRHLESAVQGTVPALLDEVRAVGHPRTVQVLVALAAAHPDPALAKAVRRAAFQVHTGGVNRLGLLERAGPGCDSRCIGPEVPDVACGIAGRAVAGTVVLALGSRITGRCHGPVRVQQPVPSVLS